MSRDTYAQGTTVEETLLDLAHAIIEENRQLRERGEDVAHKLDVAETIGRTIEARMLVDFGIDPDDPTVTRTVFAFAASLAAFANIAARLGLDSARETIDALLGVQMATSRRIAADADEEDEGGHA